MERQIDAKHDNVSTDGSPLLSWVWANMLLTNQTGGFFKVWYLSKEVGDEVDFLHIAKHHIFCELILSYLVAMFRYVTITNQIAEYFETPQEGLDRLFQFFTCRKTFTKNFKKTCPVLGKCGWTSSKYPDNKSVIF